MTQQKQFNSYKEGLDLEFLRVYCMEHGERRVMERGETLEEAGGGGKGISSPAFYCEWGNIFFARRKKWKKLSSHNLLTC